jgi:multisubunit Na+/H+ antiporter MnhF subunit
MSVLGIAALLSGAMLCVAVGLATWRMLVGPSLADRAVALDLLGLLAVSAAALLSFALGAPALLDVALVLGLVGFIGGVVLGRFMETAGARGAGRREGDG